MKVHARTPSSIYAFATKVIAGCALFTLAISGFCQEKAPTPPQTVAVLDTDKYMGTWYEIARFPNRFQTQCAGKVSATYQLQGSGHIEVTNSCELANGQRDSTVGEAKLGSAGLNTQLRVSFLPKIVRWLPIGWGDYWVIDLASDYRYAVVGDPSRKFLWLLSRTPTMAVADRMAIETRLQAQSYDTRRLVNTPQ